MPTLVVRYPDGSEHEHEVVGQLTVGRAEGNDLILSEGGVSRKHARFFEEGSELLVEDVGSANGTFVNGEQISEAVSLSSKAQVVIGDYEISLKAQAKSGGKTKASGSRASKPKKPEADDEALEDAPKSTRMVPAMKGTMPPDKRPKPQGSKGPVLRGVGGDLDGQVIKLSGVLTVGRVAGVGLQIEDDSVSRKHAEVEVLGKDEVVVRDLGSANGTAVNGAPIASDTQLQPGDVVQFGVIEFVYENGPAREGGAKPAAGMVKASGRSSGPSNPSRRPGTAAQGSLRRRSREEPPPDEGGGDGFWANLDPLRKKLVIAGGVLVALLIVGGTIKAVSTPPDDGPVVDPSVVPPKVDPNAPVAPKSQTEKLGDLMISARTLIEKEQFAVAREKLREVLEIEPIHDEANQLMRQSKIDEECVKALAKGDEFKSLNQFDEALNAYEKVTLECSKKYHLAVLEKSKDPIAEVKKDRGDYCKRMTAARKFEFAEKACGDYMRLACQAMTDEELYPPSGYTVKLEPGKLKGDQWRPASQQYLNFLSVRQKLKRLDQWKCPTIPAFRPPPPPPDPSKKCKVDMAGRYPDPAFGGSLALYFDGKQAAEFTLPIQKGVLEVNSKASLHDQARDTINQLSLAFNFYQSGQTQLANGRLVNAELPFTKALEIDEQIVLGPDVAKKPADVKKPLLEKCASYVRRQIITSISSQAYQKGKELFDRKDFRAGCEALKVGYRFSRTHSDLLRAIDLCTRKAEEAFASAQSLGSCEAYKVAWTFAVPGDGYDEKVRSATEKMNCDFLDFR